MFLVCRLLSLYLIAIFARVLLSWFPLTPDGAMSRIYGVLYTITEPVLGPLRRLLPAMPLDLSPIIVLIAINIVQASLGCTRGLI